MAISVVDLYKNYLPKTNCKDCGFNTCLAFASMVVSEQYPVENCPHLSPDTIEYLADELEKQYAAGKWTKKDMAGDALQWAKERSASMNIVDLPGRIGGTLIGNGGSPELELPYFTGSIIIRNGEVTKKDGTALNRWEQVFIFNHMAQGGSALPTGNWKALEQIPNTISKIKSMKSHVEIPLEERFRGCPSELPAAAAAIGGVNITGSVSGADVAVRLQPLPKIPVLILFWDEDPDEGFFAKAKLLFDETIVEHLDIESIMFLSERIRQLLCKEDG